MTHGNFVLWCSAGSLQRSCAPAVERSSPEGLERSIEHSNSERWHARALKGSADVYYCKDPSRVPGDRKREKPRLGLYGLEGGRY